MSGQMIVGWERPEFNFLLNILEMSFSVQLIALILTTELATTKRKYKIKNQQTNRVYLGKTNTHSTNSPSAVTLSWQESYINQMTYKPLCVIRVHQ